MQGSIGDEGTPNVGVGVLHGDNKEKGEVPLTDTDDSAGGAYPQNVLAFLFFVGIISEAPAWFPIWNSQPFNGGLPSMKWVYTSCVRFVIVVTSLYCIFIVLVMKLSVSDADRKRAGYRWFAGIPSFECERGLAVQYDSELGNVSSHPCIYTYAKAGTLPLFGASCLLMYGWLFRELGVRSMHLRSHALRVSLETNKWTIKYCWLGLASVALVLVCICVSTRAELIRAGLSVHSTWFIASMGKAAGVGLGVGVTTLPFSALSLLLHTECCRLQCAVDDALVSMTLPFDFETQAAAYQSLHREFVTSQKAWGGPVGFSIVSVTIMLACFFLESAYIHAVHLPTEMFYQYSALIIVASYPLVVQLRAIIRVNFAAEEFKKRCLTLIKTLPPAQLNLESASVVQDALRLAMIVEKRPCALSIFGYSPRAGDFVKAVSGIVAMQFASFFGVSFVFGK